VDLTPEEQDLLLAALWVFSITRFDNDPEQRAAAQALALRLGADLDATYFKPARGSRELVNGSL
jgi:hypothetical protein